MGGDPFVGFRRVCCYPVLPLPSPSLSRLQVLQLHLQPSACSPTMHGCQFSVAHKVLRPPCFGSADLDAPRDSLRLVIG
jgi:hypothetical protein